MSAARSMPISAAGMPAARSRATTASSISASSRLTRAQSTRSRRDSAVLISSVARGAARKPSAAVTPAPRGAITREGPRIRATAGRTGAAGPGGGAAGGRPPARPDLDEVHGRDAERPAAALLAEMHAGHLELVRHERPPAMNEAGLGRGATHVEGDEV